MDFIWEAILIEFQYEKCYEKIICEHESVMNEKCQDIMKTYKLKFAEYGLDIVYTVYWYNSLTDFASSKRILFENGYRCNFTVGIRKDGQIICYDNEEGSTLGADFNISSISRFFFHLDVTLCEDTDDIIEELNEMLEIAKQLFGCN